VDPCETRRCLYPCGPIDKILICEYLGFYLSAGKGDEVPSRRREMTKQDSRLRLVGVLRRVRTRSNKAVLVSEWMQYGFIGGASTSSIFGSFGNRNASMTPCTKFLLESARLEWALLWDQSVEIVRRVQLENSLQHPCPTKRDVVNGRCKNTFLHGMIKQLLLG
jgi:hypothetical protein